MGRNTLGVKMNEIFEKFLLGLKVKTKFYNNLKAFNEGLTFYPTYESRKYSLYIKSAFKWDETKEKEKFWKKIHLKWQEEIKNINKALKLFEEKENGLSTNNS